MLMHGLDDLGCRDRPCARETLQKRCQAKEMIAVPVGDIDRGEVLAARDQLPAQRLTAKLTTVVFGERPLERCDSVRSYASQTLFKAANRRYLRDNRP